MKAETKTHQAVVFYDGQCPICSREVRLYRRLDRVGRILWRDVRRPYVLTHETFTRQAAMALLHVKDAHGGLHIGLQAHLHMWAQLPGFRHLAAFLRAWPRLARLVDAVYVFLTPYRPGLVKASRPGRQR